MTTFTAPFNVQIVDNTGVVQPASFPHYTTVYAIDADGNVTSDITGQVVTVLAGSIAPGAASETTTAYSLPAGAILVDVFLNVTTAEVTGATKTVDVGLLSSQTGGDADGFLDGVSVASTGLKRGVATVTVGGTETYFASTTRGVLLAKFAAGSNTAGANGLNYELPFLTSSVTAKTISYTPGSVFSECVASIYVTYIAISS